MPSQSEQGCASWWRIQSIIPRTTSRELFIFHLARGTANCGKTEEQAEPDEQTPFATCSTRRMFMWHKPAVGLLLCNTYLEAEHLKEGIFPWKEQIYIFFGDVYIPRNYFLAILSWKIALLTLISEFPAFFLTVWALISPDFAGQKSGQTGLFRENPENVADDDSGSVLHPPSSKLSSVPSVYERVYGLSSAILLMKYSSI